MGFFLGLVSNVAANFVFWLLLGVAFWAISLRVARRFSRFFGVTRVSSITVIVSNLWTPQASRSGREVNLALIEKCRDLDRSTTIFFCLGIRADSSWAATEYLTRNWKGLAAEFGDADFTLCLGFPLTEKYAEEYREPLRLSIGGSR